MKDESFREYVVDQLADVLGVRTRKMFGGLGLYSDDIFFGIITREDVLYFKTDEETCLRYKEMGSDYFKPNPKQHLKNYYEVPEKVLDSREDLAGWAEEAISIASN